MFKLCSKLKSLKQALKSFNKEHYGGISCKVREAKDELSSIQTEMQSNSCQELIDKEVSALGKYSQLVLAEEAFFKQKARDNIIKLGDSNTHYFHRKVKSHCSKNKVLSIVDDQGERHEKYDEVKTIFIDHYKNLLGTSFNYPPEASSLIKEVMCINPPVDMLPPLDAEITEKEIKDTLFFPP